MVFFMGLLHYLVYFSILSASVYQATMLATDISRRWVDPVLVVVFTYGLPPAHVTSISLGDAPVQSAVGFLEPIVVEAVSPVAVLDVDVYAYGVPRHADNADATVALLNGPPTQGVLIELLRPIVVESICPVATPQPLMTLATIDDRPPTQAFIPPPPIGLAPTVSPAPSNLTRMFVSLAFVTVVAAFAWVLRRASRSSQGGEVVEDIPLPDWQTEWGTTSLWVLSVEPMINSASLSSGHSPYSDIFHLPRERVCVQCTFEICQAEDTSVPRESVSAQDVLSLYVRVPEPSSIPQIIVEELNGIYDVSENIAFAMRSVMREDDLRTMASTISFPPVNDFAPPTEFLKSCQAVFNELAGGTKSMVPSLSLLSVTDLGSIPFDLRSAKPFESTEGFEGFDFNWSTLTREAWVRDFWCGFLSDPDLVKFVYGALLPADTPKIVSTENVAGMSEAMILSIPRFSSAQPSNSVLRFSSENLSPGDLEGEQSFESSTIPRDEHSPRLNPITPSSLFARPSNPVLRCSDPDSYIDDLEVEKSFGSSAAAPIRRGMSSPSQIPVACWRRRAFVPLIQVTRSVRTCGPSSSRIPIRSGRGLRFRMDVPPSISSLKPNRAKRSTPARFHTVVPVMRRLEESGTPARSSRHCLACSKCSPRRSD
ncbi:hypothetical protein IW261DRAFT_353752 [Armillaria novae-zelandiae]|uniref:Transmembrane protein n=1 Tax=Armillaria novae-zelandiae TaxID=153914 RepID=A0AA39UI49_9AGAR|nr:hypothetical protein IW261DRAFT_353752 [Armillaria novae-zelandiae]